MGSITCLLICQYYCVGGVVDQIKLMSSKAATQGSNCTERWMYTMQNSMLDQMFAIKSTLPCTTALYQRCARTTRIFRIPALTITFLYNSACAHQLRAQPHNLR